jgi:hypothetical protein
MKDVHVVEIIMMVIAIATIACACSQFSRCLLRSSVDRRSHEGSVADTHLNRNNTYVADVSVSTGSFKIYKSEDPVQRGHWISMDGLNVQYWSLLEARRGGIVD